jgi:hypothetical protein
MVSTPETIGRPQEISAEQFNDLRKAALALAEYGVDIDERIAKMNEAAKEKKGCESLVELLDLSELKLRVYNVYLTVASLADRHNNPEGKHVSFAEYLDAIVETKTLIEKFNPDDKALDI